MKKTMTIHTRSVALALLLLQGCDSETTAGDCSPASQPSTIGPVLYTEHDCSPSHYCGKAALYRAGDRVQLLEFDVDGVVIGEARGVLAATVAQSLDLEIAAIIDEGADVGAFDSLCMHLPGLPVVVTLPALNEVEFRHPRFCSPSGLAELEQSLHEIFLRLRTCEPANQAAASKWTIATSTPSRTADGPCLSAAAPWAAAGCRGSP